MAVSRSTGKKAPSQNPVSFFECEQKGGGGVNPSASKVGDKLASGKQREKVYGRSGLSKQTG